MDTLTICIERYYGTREDGPRLARELWDIFFPGEENCFTLDFKAKPGEHSAFCSTSFFLASAEVKYRLKHRRGEAAHTLRNLCKWPGKVHFKRHVDSDGVEDYRITHQRSQ